MSGDNTKNDLEVGIDATLVLLERRATSVIFQGYKFDDKNIKNNVLVLVSQNLIYSFAKSDIVDEEVLHGGQSRLWIRRGSLTWRSDRLNVGKPFSEEKESLFVGMESYAPPVPLDVRGAPMPATNRAKTYELEIDISASPQLSDLKKVWNVSCSDCEGKQSETCCKGKQKYDNNCAHFLSDALIRCGFKELLTDSGFYRCHKRDCQCPSERRPIRAREMWSWFKKKGRERREKISWNEIGRNSGWWAVFQLSEGEYWGGHVIVLDTDAWEYYGTCSYPAWDQYIYKF